MKEKYEIEAYEAAEYINHLIKRKERARTVRYVLTATDNILVPQLVDGALDNIVWVLAGLQDDFMENGFKEIWLADYSGYDAYGDIELFGLYPERWWGYHPRPWPNRKPYG